MDKPDAGGSTQPSQRLDKWLKIARLFKTRSLATAACEERRVKVNGAVAKPAKEIRPGDTLTIRTHGGTYIELEVLQLCNKSIAAAQARQLYELHVQERTPEEVELMRLFSTAVQHVKPAYKGRPTKKERRRLEQHRRDTNPWR
ncbi:MAG TPA: RNA-binding S4 domain-containing protein [bacterium]|nr:RNA-binding S4 domain-containing protein [bacterium]HQG47008.1 RNA-binding S4 domain-containing protein [bacterium]HQI50383.1 RNA-binding S4 domain-containing protein [bacterium]HQJ64708.1 RNA-binding S4 domain-containing protein [bacterium]